MAPLAIAAAIAALTLWDDNHRLRDELDAAHTALDGIQALLTVGRSPRTQRALPSAGVASVDRRV